MSSTPDPNATLDHIVLGVPDLEIGIEHLARKLGATPTLGGRHRAAGTHNAILPLRGGHYLELIARDPSCPRPPHGVLWGLDELEAPRLITWAAATREIDAAVEHARQAGHDPGASFEVARDTPNGERLTWRLTLSGELAADGIVPFLIDWGSSPHPSTTSEALCSIEGFLAEHPDPQSVRAMLNALGASLEVERAEAPRLRATIVGPAGRIDLS